LDPLTPVSYGRGMRWLWMLLFAVGCAAPKYADSADYLPFEKDRAWVYSVKEEGTAAFTLHTRAYGSDVRSLEGERRVEFRFVYGRPDGMDQDVTKSIYAMASDGPREFHFSAWSWSIAHEPPIPLLPASFERGKTTEWKGVVEYRDERYETTAQIRVAGMQFVETPFAELNCILVITDYGAGKLRVHRWFAPGVGLVEVKITGDAGKAVASLISYKPPAKPR